MSIPESGFGLHIGKDVKLDVLKMNKDHSLHSNILDYYNMGIINCCQIFTHGPYTYAANDIDIEELRKVSKVVPIYVHASYVSVGVWNLLKNDNTKGKIALKHIEKQLIVCNKIKAKGFVLHISKVYPEIVSEIVKYYLKPLFIKYNIKLLLEMISSKMDDSTYETPEKIDNLTHLIGKGQYYGYCIDTSHIWAANVDVRTFDSMQKWLNECVNKKKIYLIHLNGSKTQKGSGKDIHAIPMSGDDVIWNKTPFNDSGLKCIIEYCKKKKVPIISEIHFKDEKNNPSQANSGMLVQFLEYMKRIKSVK